MAQKNFIKRVISSPLVRTFLIFVSGGWISLEMTDYFINKYGLNERISDILPIILLIGLPLAIILTWFLGREKEEEIKEKIFDEAIEKKPSGVFKAMWRKPWFLMPGVVVILLLILTGIRSIHLEVKKKWAKELAMPQMQNWVHDWDHVNAFQLRQQVKKYIPDDPEFIELDSKITNRYTIITDPEGADIYYKEYPDVKGEWIFLGQSPLHSIEIPNMTMFRWKMEKPEYEIVYAVASTQMDTLFRTMHENGKIPPGMVYVEGINMETAGDFLSEEKHGFFIDKYEVSNKQFKEFIDHEGYQNQDFWQNEFILNEEVLSFKEAMDHFIDATGRAGPSTWEAGGFPDGQKDYPVSGISWYEAAAYAVYANKSLPTLRHWQSAAGLKINQYIGFVGSNLIPLSNMRGIGPEPIGSNPGVSCFGTYDMSGNVREWCWNDSPVGRIILGGAWNDVPYLVIDRSHLPAFDRSAKNGFRCAVFPDREQIPDETFQPVELEIHRDYRSEEPVSDIEFQILKMQFQYDKTDLNSKIEDRDETPAEWTIEIVSFDAAYEQDRMLAYLFLPKEAVPPYQTLIYFPGSSSLNIESIFDYRTTSRNLYYIIKNGRAVIFPIYTGTYERMDGICNPGLQIGQSHQYTECMVKWVKDLSRSIDYLETRADIDTARLGFLGDSWGGRLGNIIPAVEDRIKLSILLRGGFPSGKKFPESDEINYVSHVKTPVLMINGKYDFEFPYETSVKPMFDLLGTAEQNKKIVLCNTDHFIPKTEMIKETLNWLDKYFGPVNK